MKKEDIEKTIISGNKYIQISMPLSNEELFSDLVNLIENKDYFNENNFKISRVDEKGIYSEKDGQEFLVFKNMKHPDNKINDEIPFLISFSAKPDKIDIYFTDKYIDLSLLEKMDDIPTNHRLGKMEFKPHS